MTVKLIAIDMDGTLLDSKKQLPQENIRALKEATEAGIKVVICTGRPLVGVKPFFEQLDVSPDDYVIVNNGCCTHKRQDWELVDDFHLTPEELTYLYRLQEDIPGVQLTAFDTDHYYVVAQEPLPIISWDAGLVFTEPVCVSLEELLSKDVTYFEAMIVGEAADLDPFQETYEAVLSERFSTVRSQHYIFETMPKGATKATALAKLAEKLGYSPEEVMALGDANNDLEMLSYAGYSVAMGNSPDHVKALAKYVTGTNDEAGVAQAIDRWALKKGY